MAEDILSPGMLLSGWIIYTIIAGILNWHQRRTQAIFQSKMLDKIGSVNELGVFLNTDAGIRFLKGLTGEFGSPQIRILRGVQHSCRALRAFESRVPHPESRTRRHSGARQN